MTGDIGLSWVAAQCDDLEDLPPEDLDCLVERGPVAAMLRVTERAVAQLDSSAALQLGLDVQSLLRSPLPDGTIRTVWLGATDHVFDPAKDDMDARTWLRKTEAAWLSAMRRTDPTFAPQVAADPGAEEELQRAVLAAIGSVAGLLTNAAERQIYPLPLRGLVPALEQVVTQVCADLGYRLFLRAMKAYFVEIDKKSHDAFIALGERFGYPKYLVGDGLNYRE
ncbi:hypothetical protein [Streptomyces sp. MUM 178J]|uniref:hypothetical protein n=1 Tax=Streptomyces sp. MUM 178J TaxID=2791991 RepID=UPI001F034E92|nr:hypothetical protein [Streptomyces sp. MUM 178J]WRQ81811.1 hypothetical protein I3F59_021980 [Streptomyces sp. MUM 178J]